MHDLLMEFGTTFMTTDCRWTLPTEEGMELQRRSVKLEKKASSSMRIFLSLEIALMGLKHLKNKDPITRRDLLRMIAEGSSVLFAHRVSSILPTLESNQNFTNFQDGLVRFRTNGIAQASWNVFSRLRDAMPPPDIFFTIAPGHNEGEEGIQAVLLKGPKHSETIIREDAILFLDHALADIKAAKTEDDFSLRAYKHANYSRIFSYPVAEGPLELHSQQLPDSIIPSPSLLLFDELINKMNVVGNETRDALERIILEYFSSPYAKNLTEFSPPTEEVKGQYSVLLNTAKINPVWASNHETGRKYFIVGLVNFCGNPSPIIQEESLDGSVHSKFIQLQNNKKIKINYSARTIDVQQNINTIPLPDETNFRKSPEN